MWKRRGSAAVIGGDRRPSDQIYVGNLSYRVREAELEKFFAQYGVVTSARVIRDMRTKRSKGYAFVTFQTVQALDNALSADGQEMAGRMLVVRRARPRTQGEE
ncbi:MAG: hypothetical protein A3J38_01140 [Gammaproteobacteria bacterium RIFCSPHIGHO2_12_FULL_45_9]|nr:MAG: hypothetical protein A3J38_01140 [Gammaproteobacteria bacterium RIFCSPHIGHO2_12_FULL_45_9]